MASLLLCSGFNSRNYKDRCVCGVVVSTHIFGMEYHQNTEKHANMLKLKEMDPESWRLALDPKTEQVKCACGKMVCRWTVFRHERTPSHIKVVSKKKNV